MTNPSNSFLDLTQGVTVPLGTLRSGAPDVMYAANAIAAFDEFSREAST